MNEAFGGLICEPEEVNVASTSVANSIHRMVSVDPPDMFSHIVTSVEPLLTTIS